jgi:hypothetical protein
VFLCRTLWRGQGRGRRPISEDRTTVALRAEQLRISRCERVLFPPACFRLGPPSPTVHGSCSSRSTNCFDFLTQYATSAGSTDMEWTRRFRAVWSFVRTRICLGREDTRLRHLLPSEGVAIVDSRLSHASPNVLLHAVPVQYERVQARLIGRFRVSHTE